MHYFFSALAIGGIIGGGEKQPSQQAAKQAPAAATASVAPTKSVDKASGSIVSNKVPVKSVGDSKQPVPTKFIPPPESAIPKNEFGATVLMGKNIFVNTQQYAQSFVGNGLNCANCHLDNGRKADSAPLWAAYVLYPAYRKKTGQVDTIQSRIQGCFTYSMNGKPPALDSKEMTALVTYHYWLASGAPTGVKLPGQGFVKVPTPAQTPDLARGGEVYKNNCALCHGANGEGTKANGKYAFPPLWGKDSFNWGAGMHRIDTAAGFIKANMPYGRGGTLSDQEAWDVALFMNSHERPKDPRFKDSIAQTRDKDHDENCLYGRTPKQLVTLLEKKAKAESEKKVKQTGGQASGGSTKPVPGSLEGYSPATAH
ncbi:MAG: c-type cytochrome [Glaciimonas sp.]|nr:c-type cytochrome [Glaciimonas sp.]